LHVFGFGETKAKKCLQRIKRRDKTRKTPQKTRKKTAKTRKNTQKPANPEISLF